MKVHFHKYQATGNDFVVVDNREHHYVFSPEQIGRLCDRRFGVGADGLMLIAKHPHLDFDLIYYNSDGSQSLCGNGSRAAVSFASSLGLVNGKAQFNAYDGPHVAELLASGIVRLKMNDVGEIKTLEPGYFVHTGSPHVVRFVDRVADFPVYEEGKKIRYSEAYKPGGTNVNFVEGMEGNTLFVRTYERGVENETLSCGTGITACALAASLHGYTSPVSIKTRGGNLSVEFTAGPSHTFRDIYLVGPAQKVFEGTMEL